MTHTPPPGAAVVENDKRGQPLKSGRKQCLQEYLKKKKKSSNSLTPYVTHYKKNSPQDPFVVPL